MRKCHGRYGHMYKKYIAHTQCVKRRRCSGDSSFSCLSHSHYLTVCTVITNNSPYIEKWGVQSRPPHRNVCLFECYPQKDVNVWMLPTVGCFCLRVTHRKSLFFSVTQRKLLLFQGYPQKNLKVTESPTERCFCFNVTHRKVFRFWVTHRNPIFFESTHKRGFLWKSTYRTAEKAWATHMWNKA